jgi:hypothetical protein
MQLLHQILLFKEVIVKKGIFGLSINSEPHLRHLALFSSAGTILLK